MYPAVGLACALLLAACTDMYDNQRMKPLEESKFFADGQSARPLVEGTVPRGSVRKGGLLESGKVDGQFADLFPFPITREVLEGGRQRFNTFCSPCHGRLGNGEGMIVLRGFPKPNSFHSDSLRAKPAGYFFDVITNGFGRMYSYAPSIAVRDRWSIVAYIRTLQLSQNVPLSSLQERDRSRIGRPIP